MIDQAAQHDMNMPKSENIDSFESGKQYDISIDKIRSNPNQPRKCFDVHDQEVLKNSIEKDGLLQAIAVTADDDGMFTIISGERRFRAWKELGHKTIPARIIDGDKEDLALIENAVRKDLNPMERAIAMKAYMDKHSYKRKELIAKFALSKAAISEIYSLNKLSAEIQEELLQSNSYPLRKIKGVAAKKTAEEQRRAFEKLKEMQKHKAEKAQDKQQRGKKIFNAENTKKRLKQIASELTHLAEYSSEERLAVSSEITQLSDIINNKLNTTTISDK